MKNRVVRKHSERAVKSVDRVDKRVVDWSCLNVICLVQSFVVPLSLLLSNKHYLYYIPAIFLSSPRRLTCVFELTRIPLEETFSAESQMFKKQIHKSNTTFRLALVFHCSTRWCLRRYRSFVSLKAESKSRTITQECRAYRRTYGFIELARDSNRCWKEENAFFGRTKQPILWVI